MATILELINQCNTQIDESYENRTYYDWFQACLMDLSPVLFNPTLVELELVDGQVALPTNFKKAIRMLLNGQEIYPIPLGSKALGYYILDGVIYFPGTEADKATLFYDRIPHRIASENATSPPDLPEEHHNLLVLYAGMRAMLLEDEVGYEDRYKPFLESYTMGKGILKVEMEGRRKTATSGIGAQWVVIR